jgi:hypothetical protein
MYLCRSCNMCVDGVAVSGAWDASPRSAVAGNLYVRYSDIYPKLKISLSDMVRSPAV